VYYFSLIVFQIKNLTKADNTAATLTSKWPGKDRTLLQTLPTHVFFKECAKELACQTEEFARLSEMVCDIF
jgi:hypothetical protein